MSQAEKDGPQLSIESFIEAAEVFPGLVMQPHAELDLNSLDRVPFENPAPVLAGGGNRMSAPVAAADSEPDDHLNTAGEDIKAELTPLKARPPNYPWQARRKGIEGFVKLEFSVDEEGRVKDVEILDAMPEGVFEKAASRAISRWTFEEAEQSGARYRQVFDFELQDIERGPPRSRPCVLTGTRTCGIVSPGVFVVWVNETTRHTEGTGVK
jgi:TonB family protein